MHRRIIAALITVLVACLAPSPARCGVAAIELTKTVGVFPGGIACPMPGDMVTVVRGTSVSYCYDGFNAGSLDLVTHTIVDSVLGNVETDSVVDLLPGQTLHVGTLFTPCATITNVATWTAGISGSVQTVTSNQDSATVTVEEPVPSLLLTKTVSKDGGCPGVKQAVVLAGANVTYCYEVGNNGNIALTVHTLLDSELGLIMISPTSLAPGSETPVASRMAIINQDTVNDAAATAAFTISCEDQTITGTATANDSAEVVVADPTPALENAALAAAALMLLGIGGLSLSRRRRLE